MYKPDLALNNLRWLLCPKTKPNNILSIMKYIYIYIYIYTYTHTQVSWGKSSQLWNFKAMIIR